MIDHGTNVARNWKAFSKTVMKRSKMWLETATLHFELQPAQYYKHLASVRTRNKHGDSTDLKLNGELLSRTSTEGEYRCSAITMASRMVRALLSGAAEDVASSDA